MADSNPPREGGIQEENTFPNRSSRQGKTMSDKLVLEKGYSVPSYDKGGEGHLNPENVRENAPMKDTPHPHTGEDIHGEY